MNHPGKIDKFAGNYRFLSNFYMIGITYRGIRYPSVEHAYQAEKSADVDERLDIAALPTPRQAKAAGKSVNLRMDWESVKLEVMEDLLRLKFSVPALRQRLLDTLPHELVEGNSWGDTYWGVCNGVGENHLGRLLMKLREEYRYGGS